MVRRLAARRTARLRAAWAVVLVLGLLPLAAPASASLVGELSGTVTGAGEPLSNVWVTMTPVNEQGEATGDPKRTVTDFSGHYEFPEVPDRNVKVQARAPLFTDLVDTYWPRAYTFVDAGIVGTSGWPVRADIDLPFGGFLSGRVLDLATGTPVAEARVTASIVRAPPWGPVGTQQTTGEPGQFAISALPPVPVRLYVTLPHNSRYLAPAFDVGAPALPVIDGAATTTGVEISLRRGAEVRGTVRDDRGVPVANAEVQLVKCLPACPPHAFTDDMGRYRIRGIPPGSGMTAYSSGDRRLLPQWYQERATVDVADSLPDLADGDVVRSIDFALVRGARIRIHLVAGDSGRPITGAIVQVVSTTDPYNRHFAFRAGSDPGLLSIGPIPPDTYALNVKPGSSNPRFLPLTRFVEQTHAPDGLLRLDGDDEVDLLVVLQTRPTAGNATPEPGPLQGTPDSSLAPTHPLFTGTGAGSSTEPGAWPGLDRGFLAAAT